MKKVSLMLIALLTLILLSSVVLAEENNSIEEELDVTEDAELEEADETQVSEEEIADELDEETGVVKQKKIKPYIRTLFFSGTGIASNPNDALDFYTVKVVGGKVALSNGNIIGRGILVLDKERFRLIKLVVEGDNAKAVIAVYTENLVSAEETSSFEEVGTLSLTKVAKPNVDVWAGTMTLNSQEYHFYLKTHKRLFKVTEIAEKARNYCRDHPYDEKCKSVAGYLCKENPRECRLKVYRYCEDHPNDSRCKEITVRYCVGNLKDSRCRELFKDYCEKNPNSGYCKHEIVDFCKENPSNEKCQSVFTEYCKTHPKEARCRTAEINFCKNNPSNEKCVSIVKQYCEYNQKSELCGIVKIDYCKEHPDSEKCKATATSLCNLDKFKNTERCTAIISKARERVKNAIKNKASVVTNKASTVTDASATVAG